MLELVQTVMRGLCALLEAGDALVDRIELIAPHRQVFCKRLYLPLDALELGEDFVSCHACLLKTHLIHQDSRSICREVSPVPVTIGPLFECADG